MRILKIYFTILALGSCTPMARILIGYKTPNLISNKQIISLSKKLYIGNFPIYSLDTVYFDQIRLLYDDKMSRKIFNQPIMVFFLKMIR